MPFGFGPPGVVAAVLKELGTPLHDFTIDGFCRFCGTTAEAVEDNMAPGVCPVRGKLEREETSRGPLP